MALERESNSCTAAWGWWLWWWLSSSSSSSSWLLWLFVAADDVVERHERNFWESVREKKMIGASHFCWHGGPSSTRTTTIITSTSSHLEWLWLSPFVFWQESWFLPELLLPVPVPVPVPPPLLLLLATFWPLVPFVVVVVFLVDIGRPIIPFIVPFTNWMIWSQGRSFIRISLENENVSVSFFLSLSLSLSLSHF